MLKLSVSHSNPNNMQPIQAHQKLLTALSQYEVLEAQSIARIVLKDVFQTDHRQNKALGEEASLELERICERLRANEPVQYVTGWADFFGLRFRVNPNVLIPRQETETLVDTCLQYLKNRGEEQTTVLDIGTGSGCIAISIAKKSPKSRVFGLDVSADALLVAEANASLNHCHVGFVQHDVLKSTSLQLQGFDLIVSNPPYIPQREKDLMQANVLAHEPHLALFVDDQEPMVFYQAIARHAKKHLYAGGMLAFECNQYNAQDVATYLRAEGWEHVQVITDLAGADRVITAIAGA
jgi:release factor glutamine methyltransferase